MHYLDNAATTQVENAVADIADKVLRANFANPSALYCLGANSEDVIIKSRAKVAQSLNCNSNEVYFTASGTEANNIAIQGACKARNAWANHIVLTGYEHPCVRKTCAQLTKENFIVTVVNPNESGNVDINEIIDAVNSKTALVCAMHINNEIGSIIDVANLAKKVKEKNSRTAVHIDGVQALGKIMPNLSKTQIDSYAVSGHKIYAPKGIGALYLKNNFHINNLMHGASQERGMRPGTENIAYIAAFAHACELIKNEFYPIDLKNHLLNAVKDIKEITINSPENAHPAIVNISVERIKSEVMLHFLESKEIYVSAGASCSKGAPSHTLTSMGIDEKRAQTSLRISFGRHTDIEDINALVEALKEGIKTIAKMK